MTGDVVNLRRARKAKARTDKADKAEANRIAFGRTKSEKVATRAENSRIAKGHAAKRREPEA